MRAYTNTHAHTQWYTSGDLLHIVVECCSLGQLRTLLLLQPLPAMQRQRRAPCIIQNGSGAPFSSAGNGHCSHVERAREGEGSLTFLSVSLSPFCSTNTEIITFTRLSPPVLKQSAPSWNGLIVLRTILYRATTKTVSLPSSVSTNKDLLIQTLISNIVKKCSREYQHHVFNMQEVRS